MIDNDDDDDDGDDDDDDDDGDDDVGKIEYEWEECMYFSI